MDARKQTIRGTLGRVDTLEIGSFKVGLSDGCVTATDGEAIVTLDQTTGEFSALVAGGEPVNVNRGGRR